MNKTLGSAMFEVQLTDDTTVRRHADQLRATATPTAATSEESEDDGDLEMSTPNVQDGSGSSGTENVDTNLLGAKTPPIVAGTNERDEPSERDESSSPHAASGSDANDTSTSRLNLRRSHRTMNPPASYGHGQSD